MIYTHTDDLSLVKKMGNEFKTIVNKRYRLLEIEIDGYFQRMLLLKKKKYAALIAEEKNGEIITKLETKGLEEVRRDWCQLSKDCSRYILNQLFSGIQREELIEKIHEYLTTIGKNVRDEKFNIDKFTIYKSLTKNPEDYADKLSMPHVVVAIRMKERGEALRIHDTIPYIICEGGGNLIASKAYHPDDLKKEGSELRIGIYKLERIYYRLWMVFIQSSPPTHRTIT